MRIVDVDDSDGYMNDFSKLVVGDMMMMSSYLYVDRLILPYVD